MDREKFVNRGAWVSGAWDSELDRYEWVDELTGLPCLILRNKVGTLCGYVGIDSGNTLYGKEKTEIYRRVRVYGGVTYAGKCQYSTEALTMSHIHPIGMDSAAHYQTGETSLWWVGFDTNHYQDLAPLVYSLHRKGMSDIRVYRDLNFVKKQIIKLAAQLNLFASEQEEVNQENHLTSLADTQFTMLAEEEDNGDVRFEYRGFEGFARKDEYTGRWYGIVRGTGNNPLAFDGNCQETAFEDMKVTINNYLEVCQVQG